ncbi:MAG: immunoglobulin domain-containing protein [Verrucomicrobiota bacterium]
MTVILRRFLLASLFALVATSLRATPPLAPSNGTFTHTHYGSPYPSASDPQVPANIRHTWRLNWQDNANDEETYVVLVRYGTVGPFTTFGILPANSTTHTFSIGNLETHLTIPVQFKIEAWKYNGTVAESSTLSMSTIMPKPKKAAGTEPATDPDKQVWGPLTQLTAAPEDLDPGTAINLSDGRIKLDWTTYVHEIPGNTSSPLIPTEPTNSELGYEVRVREVKTGMTDADWFTLGNVPFNTTTFVLSNVYNWSPINSQNSVPIQLIPAKRYQFAVRPTRVDFNSGTVLTIPPSFVETSALTDGSTTNPQAFVMPNLKAPTALTASPYNETQLRLTWADNSDNETGYKIEYRAKTDASPVDFVPDQSFPVGKNVNNVLVPFIQNATVEFRVRALFQYTATTGGATTTIESDPADVATASTATFGAPTNLTATPSGLHDTIDLTWKDNSSVEGGYDILVRKKKLPTAENPTPTPDPFKFARAVRSNVTSVSLDSMAGSVDSDDGLPIAPNFVQFELGAAYEFVVRAIGDLETIHSVLSNVAEATPRPGFTMPRLYHPAKVGQSFQYYLTTTPQATRSGWTASPLPPGLMFDDSTGIISGIPTTSGVYEIPLAAAFTSSPTAHATLTLRVVGLPAQPQVTSPIANTTVGLNAITSINLASHFTDPGAEKAARLETNRGNIDIDLFATLAPEAVANFLAYVDAGDYDGVVFHRLAFNLDGTPFVLQGGSLKTSTEPRSFTSVGRRPSPTNEPGISNLRGTISAAKVGGRTSVYDNNTTATNDDIFRGDTYGYVGLPNSATTDFFLNPVNNAGNLDNQNGGFTAYGRLTDASLLILDQITLLPRGSYDNFSPEGTYDANLDKRISIDGYASSFDTFPINAGSAPADMDNTKAVKIIKARSLPVLTYTIDAASTDKASVVVENSQLKITGLGAGTRTVNVTARDVDGNTVSQPFTINVTPGFRPPVITKHPVSTTVNVKANVTLGVTATGTGLSYQWRRGGTNITGKTADKLLLSNVQAGDSGVYDVIVTAGGQSVISSPATLAIRVPADITSSLPNELLVEVGQPLHLPLTVTGSPAPTVTWRRGATVVKSQTNQDLVIQSVTLADAGLYTATAVNGSTDKSNTCNVLVVNKGTTIVAAAPNKPVKLTAPAAGPFVSYSWRKGGLPITQAGFTGTDKAILSIASAQSGTDSGDYTCVLTPPGVLPVTISGIVHLSVSDVPQLSPLAPPVGYVGDGYTYTLPYSPTDSNRPTSFTVTGLPPGLTLNTVTGVISGRPTKGGIYSIVAKATNPTGTGSPVTGTLRIFAPEVAGAGTYVGVINPAWTINDGKGGRLDLTVTDNSAWSAKLQLGKDVYNLKGTIVITPSSVSGSNSLIYGSGANFTSKTGKPLALYFEVNPNGGDVQGVVSSSTELVDINGYRLNWSATRSPCFFTGTYNISLFHVVAQPDAPQGDGYMSLAVNTAGMGTISGRLPDGTTITNSAFVGNGGQGALFQMLYKNTGSLIARMTVITARDNNSVAALLRPRYNSYFGTARWIKDKQPAAERNYQAGFPSTEMGLRGWVYTPPRAEITPIVMNLPNMAGNARIDFSQGGIEGNGPDITFRLTNANLADFTGVANPNKVTIKVTPATGAYTGTFELNDGGSKRPVTFQGLIIPAIASIPALDSFTITEGTVSAQTGVPGSSARGAGYFLLDKLPVPPSTKSAALLAGRARVGAPDPTIVTQPVSQTVNPGANVTFTCVVTGGLGDTPAITYQWRKNGVDIANATTPTLSLTNVQESSEGFYNCLIRKSTTLPASGAILEQTFVDTSVSVTDFAALTVNDPVSNLIILQNPAKPTVPTGSVVIFTAEHKGTGPFTYQWRRNGTDIPDANGISYTTGPVSNDNAGSYTVVVKSDINTGDGVLSSAKVIAHSTPVTAVSIARSPSSALIAGGTNVVFTAGAAGASPSYQWMKNDIPITGANGSTFSIPSVALTDNGSYKVIVSNAVTTDAVTSNNLALNVTPSLSNITITPSFSGQAAPTNATVSLVAAVSGPGTPSFQWRKNDVEIPGANTNVLSITTDSSINVDNPDRYDVFVTSAAVPQGVLSAPYLFRVAETVGSVVASSTPSGSGVTNGTSVTFSVTATGTNLAYQWLKNGSSIPNATQSSYTINSFAAEHEGDYTVLVSNLVNLNGVVSNTVNLSSNGPITEVSITVSPTTTTVQPGSPLVFTSNVVGGQGWTYQWRRDNADISGAISDRLEISAPDAPKPEGTPYVYDLRVTNTLTPSGVTSNQIEITVMPPP